MNAIKVSKPMFSGARNSFQVVSRGLLALHCGKYANYQEKKIFDKLKKHSAMISGNISD